MGWRARVHPVRAAGNLIKALRAGYPVFSVLRERAENNRAGFSTAPAGLEREVLYAVQVAENCLGHLAAHDVSVKGRRVLELGPGRNLGTALVLACHGARMTAVEPNAVAWEADYHPLFYAALREWLARNRSLLDRGPLDRVVRKGRIPEELIDFRPGSLEDSPSLPGNSMDIVFSNAVLEHVFDLQTTLAELARITRPGGLNFHQIDLRFHLLSSDPLKFILYNSRKYARLREFTSGECGSRVRYAEYKNLFQEAGFRVVGEEINLWADPEYLAGLRKKIKKRRSNPYRDWPAQDLAVLSARLEVRRQDPAQGSMVLK